MASISGSVVNTTFAYDANGNQTSGNGLTLTYASFNKPATIARGSALISFAHDPEHQRFRQMSSTGETLYLGGSGVMAERLLGSGGVVQWTNYLSVGGELIGMRVDRSDATTYTRYFHKDDLGSIATITDASGTVVERLSYDAWGKRRFPNGQDDPSGSIASQTTRGFTGHEQLADVGLVHMNGRVYDPMLGRFGTPDPTTESPFSSQGWNRYTYVGNSPLNFTDPSGYCFAGCFWQKPFKAIGALLRKFPILGNILTVAAAALCGPGAPVCAGIAASVTSAVVSGLASGNLGQALRAGFISAATAFAMFQVGELTGHMPAFGTENHIANIIGHAAVGCGSAVASRGKCGPGALSGAVGSFASPLTRGLSFEAGLVATSTVGGLASVAGGGKFGNGAVTAAFGYLFNNMAGALVGARRGATIVGILGLETGPLDSLLTGAGALIGGIIGDWATGPDVVLNEAPPNLAPAGADRDTALDAAKAAMGIDPNQDPDEIGPNMRGDKAEKGSEVLRYLADDGNRIVEIRHDYGGHTYPDNPAQNRGAHFNTPDNGHYDYSGTGQPFGPLRR